MDRFFTRHDYFREPSETSRDDGWSRQLERYTAYLTSSLPTWPASVREFLENGPDLHDVCVTAIDVDVGRGRVRLATRCGSIVATGVSLLSCPDLELDGLGAGVGFLYDEILAVEISQDPKVWFDYYVELVTGTIRLRCREIHFVRDQQDTDSTDIHRSAE